MTPAEKEGWKVGDRGRIEYHESEDPDPPFSDGSVVELCYDDGTACPYFKLIRGECRFTNPDGVKAAFEDLPNIKKMDSKAQILREIADEIDRVGEEYAYNEFEVWRSGLDRWVPMKRGCMWYYLEVNEIRRKPQKITLEVDREVIDKAREIGVQNHLARLILEGVKDEEMG